MTDGGNGKPDKIMKTKNGNFKKSAKKFITCYTCGKKSHKSAECLKNSNKR